MVTLIKPTGPVNINTLGKDCYQVVIHRFPGIQFFAKGVTIPGVSAVEVRQPTRGIPIMHPTVGNLMYEDLAFRFLVDEDLANWMFIHRWLKMGLGTENDTDIAELLAEFEGNLTSDISVIFTTNNKNPNIEMVYSDAFPLILSGFDMGSDDTDHTPVESSVMFKYTKFTMNIIPR